MENRQERLEALKWLLDPIGARGSGRATLLKEAYIQLAIQYPNHEFIVHDHWNVRISNSSLLQLIMQEIATNPLYIGYDFIFDFRAGDFVCTGKTPNPSS